MSLNGNTTVTGTFGVTGNSTFTGTSTVRNASATDDRLIVSAAATGAATFNGTITNSDLTAARTYTLPDATGTLALYGSFSGDATATNAGVLTLGTGAVTSTKILDDTITNSDINSAAAIAYSKLNLTSSVVNADINASAAIAYSKLNLSNSILLADLTTDSVNSAKIVDGSIATADVADNAVDGAKIALTSQATGDIMYYNGTDWVRLGIGTAGQILTTNGGATAPTWVTGSATELYNANGTLS